MRPIKEYNDYLESRAQMRAKGIKLKEAMSAKSFNAFYERLRYAKRAGEIKSQPYAELIRRERLLTRNQARIFAQAESIRTGKNVKQKDIFKMDIDTIRSIGKFVGETKEQGLYGGDYE